MERGEYQVFGSFADRERLEDALDALRQSGFRGEQISMLVADSNIAGTESDVGEMEDAAAGEGAVAGLGTGAILGGALGWLAGVGALAIPGIGPFIAAGPLASLLVGATAGGALGGISGALLGLGLSEDEARTYEARTRRGESLISISCANEEERDRSMAVLKDHGAADVSSVSRQRGVSRGAPEAGLASQIEVDRTAVERRAYEIWQEEGRPPDKAQEHWVRAEHELRRM